MTPHNKNWTPAAEEKRITCNNLNAPQAPYPITDNPDLNKVQLATGKQEENCQQCFVRKHHGGFL